MIIQMHFLKSISRFLIKNPLNLWIYNTLKLISLIIRHATKRLNIHNGVKISNCQFGYNNTIYEDAELSNVSIGDCSYIGARCRLNNVEIGKFTCIGPDVAIGYGKHPTRNFVSIHPAFYSVAEQAGFSFASRNFFDESGFCKIGSDVWIGANVTIFFGVNIGDGAIIGAGSIVTKDVLPYSIVAGSPAKLLRYRFDVEDISLLTNFKWWDRDREFLQENYMVFHSIKDLVSKIKSGDII